MRRFLAVLLSVLLALSPAVAFAGSTTFSATAGSGITFAAPTNASGNLGSAYGTVCDGAGSSVTLINCMAVLGAVAATSGSNSGVFQISPNGIGGATATPMPVSATTAQNTAANPLYVSPASSSYFEVSATNGPNTNSNPIFQAQTDGSHGTVAVKPSNTPSVTGDISEVVSISPNNTLVGLKDSGATDMTNTAAHALNVSQPTAANLNVTAVPGGSAIFQVSPTTAANTASNPFYVSSANSSYFQVSATNGANAKTNPIYVGLADGTNGPTTVKAASTQSVAGDLSTVIQINPNQPNLTTALNVSAAPATATAWGIFTNNSTTSGQSGLLGMCATTTSAPSNTNAQTNWLSCTTGGGLRGDIASVAGTAAATATSGVLKVGIVGNAGSTVDSAAGSASTNAVDVQFISGGTAFSVSPAANSLILVQPATGSTFTTTVSGTATVTPAANAVIALSPLTSGGWTPGQKFNLTNSAIAIKASQGQLAKMLCYNPNVTVDYVQVYNIAAASVTVGTSTPVDVIPVPANLNGGYALPAPGEQFNTAISFAATSTPTGGSAPASALTCSYAYN